MKRLLSILQVLLVLTSLSYGEEKISNGDTEPNVFAGVIRDAGQTSEKNWNMQNAVNIEIVHILKNGERLKEWIAYPRQLSVLVDTIITSKDPEKNRIINHISDLPRERHSQVDIAAAMEAAFDGFSERSKEYQCLLIIISTGRVNDDQVAQIRRYAGAFKARGWPVCFVCDKELANRMLLVAANNREFDLQFLGKSSLSDWIGNIRSSLNRKKSEDATPPAKPKSRDINMPAKTEDGKAGSTVVLDIGVKQPLEVKIVEPPKPILPAAVNKPKEVPTPEKAKPKTAPVIDNKVKDSKNGKSSILNFIPLALLLAMLMGAIGLIVYSGSKPALKPPYEAGEDEGQQNHLIAFVFEQRYDLGPLDALGEITVGKGVGSTIYIDNKTVEDRHLRIFKSGTGLKAQNLATSPVAVNGVKLFPRRKAVLELPADIQLTSEVTVTFLAEPLEIDKGVNNHETENL
jgi:hypothetical protein